MKVHVHVYKMVSMAEVDIDVGRIIPDTPERAEKVAMEEALSRAKEGALKFFDPDNEFMAIPFAIEGEDDG